MNEELISELREFRTLLQGNYSNEDFKSMCARMMELRNLYTWQEIWNTADFVATEGTTSND